MGLGAQLQIKPPRTTLETSGDTVLDPRVDSTRARLTSLAGTAPDHASREMVARGGQIQHDLAGKRVVAPAQWGEARPRDANRADRLRAPGRSTLRQSPGCGHRQLGCPTPPHYPRYASMAVRFRLLVPANISIGTAAAIDQPSRPPRRHPCRLGDPR
jgi:hypothetical protein